MATSSSTTVGNTKSRSELFEETLANEEHTVPERLDLHATLARAYASAGVPERAVEMLEGCIEELRASEHFDPAVEVRYATALSYALSDSGELERAGRVLSEALERARDTADDPYMRVRLYWSLARLCEMEGKSAAALHNIPARWPCSRPPKTRSTSRAPTSCARGS